jgi:hypothetical protein
MEVEEPGERARTDGESEITATYKLSYGQYRSEEATDEDT